MNDILKYRSATLRIVGIYAVVGCLWIYTSDSVLYWIVQDPYIMSKIAIYKGSFYVIFTSLLLYILINRNNNNLAFSEQALKDHVKSLLRSEANLKQTESALLNARRMHEATERIGKVGGWEFDTETLELTWTDEVYRIHEVDLTYKPTVDDGINFYTLSSRSIIEQAVARAIERGEPFDVELEITTAKGNSKAIHTIGKADRKNHKVSGFFQDITDRKKAEQTIQYERDLSIDIINAQPAGVYRIRVFAKDTWENDAWRSSKGSPYVVELASEPFCKILGTTKEVFENNPGMIIDFIHPDDREGFARKNEEAAIHLGEFMWEGRLLIDKVIRWVRFQSLPRPLENRDVLWTGALIDITDSKLIEENLHEKEFELEEAQLLAGTGSWSFDPIAQKSTWSRGMFLIWGIDPSLGFFPVADHQKYIHPDDSPRFEAVLKEALENGTPYKEELRIIRPDGIEKTIISICEPICDATGKVVKLRGSNQDITERKQIENILSDLLQFSSLHSGEDFFESLARYLSKTLNLEYVCIDRLHGDNLTATTLAVYHDGTFEDNVSYTLKDTPCGNVVGKVVCVYPENVSNLFPQDAALRELQAESYVGTTLWSFDMRPIGLIAVIGRRPMTNTLFSETVLKLVSNRAAGELERRQAEEEKYLLEQQFQQTQKLESLGVLSGGIAHDFNNILAIIMGNCSLAKMDEENAGKYIPEIEMASGRAAELCRQMLAYAGKAQFVRANVNFRSLVDEMVNMLKKTIPHNAEIKLVSATDIPPIHGDASQLNQIVMNLIINASEAIGNEHGDINVSLTETTIREVHSEKDYNGKIIQPGRYVCLEVTDNGCGMDEATKWRIFEPFYTTKFSGRGLGMSAVLGIITSHKGALQLHSQLGQGTTFKVYLPVPEKYSTEDKSQKQSIPSPWQGNGTILLVEDEDLIRKIAKELLENFGFTVLEAVNGKEALELYQKNATDITLVMTDMGMPIMDGYELFYELKKLNPKLPIIVSSGYGDAEVSSRIVIGNCAGLISKPYGADQLREVMESALEGSL